MPVNIPLGLFLIPYGLFVIVYVLFVFFNIYHLRRYGIANVTTQAILAIYIAGTVIIFGVSWLSLARVNWAEPVALDRLFVPANGDPIFPTL